jgi:Flp pilus assembly protein TadG
MRQQSRRRRGGLMLECAVLFPAAFTIIVGMIIGALGIFRYSELACLAREGARYAAVHGATYAQVTGKTAATASDVYNNAILPEVVGLDTSQLTYSVTWNPNNTPGNTVTVKLSYNWIPEAYWGTMTLESTSVMTVAY